ncbi:MAG TPA: hypothetical protein VGN22_17045 [Pseudonocardia sp.]
MVDRKGDQHHEHVHEPGDAAHHLERIGVRGTVRARHPRLRTQVTQAQRLGAVGERVACREQHAHRVVEQVVALQHVQRPGGEVVVPRQPDGDGTIGELRRELVGLAGVQDETRVGVALAVLLHHERDQVRTRGRSSRIAICWEIADCVRCSRAAAAVNYPTSATVQKIRSLLVSSTAPFLTLSGAAGDQRPSADPSPVHPDRSIAARPRMTSPDVNAAASSASRSS